MPHQPNHNPERPFDDDENPMELRSLAMSAAVIFIVLFCAAAIAGIFLFKYLSNHLLP